MFSSELLLHLHLHLPLIKHTSFVISTGEQYAYLSHLREGDHPSDQKCYSLVPFSQTVYSFVGWNIVYAAII